MSKSRAAVVLAAAAIVVVTSASCLDPTEITLSATTDAPCAGTKGAAFAGGATSNVETARPNTTTTHCEGGSIGTLVATPTGSKDA